MIVIVYDSDQEDSIVSNLYEDYQDGSLTID